MTRHKKKIYYIVESIEWVINWEGRNITKMMNDDINQLLFIRKNMDYDW